MVSGVKKKKSELVEYSDALRGLIVCRKPMHIAGKNNGTSQPLLTANFMKTTPRAFSALF